MKREKTVVDVQMSDAQIAEQQQELMRRMAKSNQKLAAEQRAHEDRVQVSYSNPFKSFLSEKPWDILQYNRLGIHYALISIMLQTP